jgi:FdhE protein
LKSDTEPLKEQIITHFRLARQNKPAYAEFYPFLEVLFLTQAHAKQKLNLPSLDIPAPLVATKWEEGFPLLQRWDFPVDLEAAEAVLRTVKDHIPGSNKPLKQAHAALSAALLRHADQRDAVWLSFLQHEWEPWEEWVETAGIDTASLLFLARSCLRPSVEGAAERLLLQHPPSQGWQKGYCLICGSLPALLTLEGEGARHAHCSWCGTKWGLQRLQCPHCDNRSHTTLGYLYLEEEPRYRIQYCELCRHYFKLLDARQDIDAPFVPLEEWTTLHLDILAQKAGWNQPPSPAPSVYPEPHR